MSNDQQVLCHLIFTYEVTKRIFEDKAIQQQRELEALQCESDFWKKVNLMLSKEQEQEQLYWLSLKYSLNKFFATIKIPHSLITMMFTIGYLGLALFISILLTNICV